MAKFREERHSGSLSLLLMDIFSVAYKPTYVMCLLQQGCIFPMSKPCLSRTRAGDVKKGLTFKAKKDVCTTREAFLSFPLVSPYFSCCCRDMHFFPYGRLSKSAPLGFTQPFHSFSYIAFWSARQLNSSALRERTYAQNSRAAFAMGSVYILVRAHAYIPHHVYKLLSTTVVDRIDWRCTPTRASVCQIAQRRMPPRSTVGHQT